MILRKFLRTFILLVFCIGLLGSLAFWVGEVPPEDSPNVGWNSFSFVFPPAKEPVIQPNVGWNSFSWVLPPEETPQVGWNSFCFAFPASKEPVVQPYVGWNSFS